ncbi:MAG: hypothetical protein ITG00_10550 [Flavobacterium sp.]|nr:hypothetical protein [Flavobacterium sp.]
MSKRTLIVVVSFLALIAIVGYFLLTNFLKAMGEECEVRTMAAVRTYEIIDKSCIGFAGPRYSTYYLYENGKNIGTGNKLDSCFIQFRARHSILDFNICTTELTESKIGIKGN